MSSVSSAIVVKGKPDQSQSPRALSPSYALLSSYFSELERRTFSAEMQTFSEATREEKVYYSNEILSLRALETGQAGIWKKGGPVVGVGVGMLLEVASISGANAIYAIDNNPLVAKILWPIILSNFSKSSTRAEFIGRLIGENISGEGLDDLSGRDIMAHAVRNSDKHEHSKIKCQHELDIVNELRPYLSETELHHAIRIVRGLNVEARFSVACEIGSSEEELNIWSAARVKALENGDCYKVPTYGMLNGRDSCLSYLGTEENYRDIRQLVIEDKFIFTGGNLYGDALSKVIDELETKEQKPGVLYVDNVPRIDSWNGTLERYRRFDKILDRIYEMEGNETILLVTAEQAEKIGHRAYPLTREEYNKLRFDRLYTSDSKEDEDIPGIIHSKLLFRFADIQGATWRGQRIDALKEVFDLGLVSSQRWDDMQVAIELVKEEIEGNERTFKNEADFFNFWDATLVGNGRKSTAHSTTLDPFFRNIAIAAFKEMKVIAG